MDWRLIHLIRYIFLLCAVLPVSSSLGAVSVKSQLDRTSVMAGETVTLNVIVEGARPERAS